MRPDLPRTASPIRSGPGSYFQEFLMTNQEYLVAANLYLGSDRQRANSQGPRAFASAAKALRFAFEHAAPVSLRGAHLQIGDCSFGRADMLALYNSRRYPLIRKNAALTFRSIP